MGKRVPGIWSLVLAMGRGEGYSSLWSLVLSRGTPVSGSCSFLGEYPILWSLVVSRAGGRGGWRVEGRGYSRPGQVQDRGTPPPTAQGQDGCAAREVPSIQFQAQSFFGPDCGSYLLATLSLVTSMFTIPSASLTVYSVLPKEKDKTEIKNPKCY